MLDYIYGAIAHRLQGEFFGADFLNFCQEVRHPLMPLHFMHAYKLMQRSW